MNFLPKRKHKKHFHLNRMCLLRMLSIFITLFSCLTIILFIPNKNKFPPDPEKPFYFNISMRKGLLKTSFMVDMHQGALFINVPHMYKCEYMNDRAFFIYPMINKLAQVMRSFRMPIIRIVPIKDHLIADVQRKRGIDAIKGGKSVIGNVNLRSSDNFKRLINNDAYESCFYTNETFIYNNNRDNQRNNDVIPFIANGFKDLYIMDISKAVYAIIGSGAKYVFICGQSLNSDIISVVNQCANAGITPIIIEELVDSNYIYQNNKGSHQNHTAFIKESIRKLTKNKAYSIHYDELMTSLTKSKGKVYPVRYMKENNTAMIFNTI